MAIKVAIRLIGEENSVTVDFDDDKAFYELINCLNDVNEKFVCIMDNQKEIFVNSQNITVIVAVRE